MLKLVIDPGTVHAKDYLINDEVSVEQQENMVNEILSHYPLDVDFEILPAKIGDTLPKTLQDLMSV